MQSSQLPAMAKIIANEAYMDYGEYQEVRKFCELSPGGLKDGGVECGLRYGLALIAAKAYYMRGQYHECLTTLQQCLPVPSSLPTNQHPSFKTLYERQTLLLKTLYLLNPKQAAQFDKAYAQYDDEKVLCCDWLEVRDDAYIYDDCIGELWKAAKRGGEAVGRGRDGVGVGAKEWLGVLESKTKVFQGIPVYLISNRWLNKAKLWAENPSKHPYPGPPLQFQLLNHIFQFQPHAQQNKEYMDTLLFPLTQNLDYQTLSPAQWRQTQKLFGAGQSIKRFPISDTVFSGQDRGDCLVRTVVEAQGRIFVFQWQAGTRWECSILVCLRDSLLGVGQMKMVVKGEGKLGEYVEEVVVGKGVIMPTKYRYKYTNVYPQLKSKISQTLFKYFITRYNLQPHGNPPDPSAHTLGLIAIKSTQSFLKKSQKSPLSEMNANQLNCAFHCLASISELMALYCGNSFVAELDAWWTEAEIQYAVGFGDWAKRMVYGDWRRDAVECGLMIQLMGNWMATQKNGKKWSTFPYSTPNSTSIYQTLHSLILPLHHTPPSQSPAPTSLLYSQFQHMKMHAVAQLRKENPLEIYSLFNHYHYREYSCASCGGGVGYKIVPALGLEVAVPEAELFFQLYFVMPGGIGAGKGHDAHTDELISAKEILDTQNTMTNFKLGKIVQQIVFKLPIESTIDDAYKLLLQKFSIDLQLTKSELITILINEGNSDYIELYSTNAKDQVISIKEINRMLWELNNQCKEGKDGDKKEGRWAIFVFLTGSFGGDGNHLSVVSYRNPVTGKNKAFPELIRLPELKITVNEGLSHEKNKQIIRSYLSNPKIEIKQLEILTKKSKDKQKQKEKQKQKQNERVWINIYTDAKIGSSEKTTRRLILQDQSKMKQKQKNEVSLEQCIMSKYCQAENDKSKPQMKSQQKALCHKCKKQSRCYIRTKLLQFRKVLLISINRKSPQSPNHRIPTCLKYPQILHTREFLSSPAPTSSPNLSLPPKKKQTAFILKSIGLYLSPLDQGQGQSKVRRRYGCVRRGRTGEGWWLLQGEDVREIGLEQVEGERVDMLLYEREQM